MRSMKQQENNEIIEIIQKNWGRDLEVLKQTSNLQEWKKNVSGSFLKVNEIQFAMMNAELN